MDANAPTVRQALRWRCAWIVAAAASAGAWVIAWGQSRLVATDPALGIPVMLLGLVPVLLARRAARRTRCPRCQGPLTRHLNGICFGALAACPHCALPLDRPPPRSRA